MLLFDKTKTTNTGQQINIQYRFNIQEDTVLSSIQNPMQTKLRFGESFWGKRSPKIPKPKSVLK